MVRIPTLEPCPGDASVLVIDQKRLPFECQRQRLQSAEDAFKAISEMTVRGAPLIGITAAFGIAFEMKRDPSDQARHTVCEYLEKSRPTAVNLAWAIQRMQSLLESLSPAERAPAAWNEACAILQDDIDCCRAIGDAGLSLITDVYEREGRCRAVNILTHCNAGRLATGDYGTALAPIYRAHEEGIPLHVWVDETRPRNQGASLTAWELHEAGIQNTIIADNAGGHLMQHGLVDLCIVGSDRTTRSGDVCNKIGTYLKALAAEANQIPFYVALPYSTIDWSIDSGLVDIQIEQRSPDELRRVRVQLEDGRIEVASLMPEEFGARNDAFDVTPADLVTELITERGRCLANAESLLALYGLANV